MRCFVSIHALKCRSSNWYSLQLCFASLLSSCLLVFFLAVRTQSAARCGDFSNEGTRAHVPGYIYFSSGVMGFVRRLSPIEKQVAVCWVGPLQVSSDMANISKDAFIYVLLAVWWITLAISARKQVAVCWVWPSLKFRPARRVHHGDKF